MEDCVQGYGSILQKSCWEPVYQPIYRTAARFELLGGVDPNPEKGAQSKLTVYDEFVILDSILAQLSMYLGEVQQKLSQTTGNVVHESTICQFLKRNKFFRKTVSLVAAQQRTEERAQFLSNVSIYRPEMLVFVNETGTD